LRFRTGTAFDVDAMLQLILAIVMRRLLTAIPTLLMLSLVVFVVLRLLPVDPLAMMLPPSATAADAAALRQQLGFDRPIPVQFLIWLGEAGRGSLGNSINFHQPVITLIRSAVPATIELAVMGLLLALVISIPGGVLAYMLYKRQREILADLTVTLLQSVPSFLWALLLILVFGVLWPVLPFSGRVEQNVTLPGITGFALIDLLITGQFVAWLGAWSHLLLPALALALSFAPLVIRVLRSGLIEAAGEPYVEVARLRGLSETRILWRHMLKNAALPTVTMIGVQFGFLFGGALLVEMIFGFPGVGNLMVQAVKGNDLPLIQGIALLFCVLMLAINAVVDVLYAVLNPRLRTM
jgi:dipeptide transport system permease protein